MHSAWCDCSAVAHTHHCCRVRTVLCCAVPCCAVLRYVQMGTDLDRLQSALDFVRQTVQQLSQEQPGFNAPELLGSVFLPSKRLLAQMKFRWGLLCLFLLQHCHNAALLAWRHC